MCQKGIQVSPFPQFVSTTTETLGMADTTVIDFVNRTAKKYHSDDIWYYELVNTQAIIFTHKSVANVIRLLAPIVYHKALELAGADQEARQHIWVRIREVILKATIIVGQAKAYGAEKASLPLLKSEDVPTAKGIREWGPDEAMKKQGLE
jgi:hypothetical protein